jgi:hypothetical protein
MRSSALLLILAGLLAVPLAGCEHSLQPIPAGAQQVSVEVTETGLRLDPPTAHPGDLYVVLVTPGSSVEFVQRKASAEAQPGPLTDEDLARLARNRDTFGIASEGFENGCVAGQHECDGGRVGYGGNAFMLTLASGSYAFLTIGEPGGPPRSMAILRVTP